jgi:UDP-N-acetyl-D-mannosaminuronic acid dehydrogenase
MMVVERSFMKKVFVIGGLGHIGLSLAAVISNYYEILLFDTNQKAKLEFILNKKAIFFEPGINELLEKNQQNISIVDDFKPMIDCDYIVVTVGTHTDEYLNPILSHVFKLFKNIRPYLSNQIIILRSTMYPGMTKKIEKMLNDTNVKIAFCPERVQSGNMIKELQSLPQIISANSQESLKSAQDFFNKIEVKQKILKNTTAGELAKMMTNAYRYVEFAIANQFFMMASDANCDFFEIFDAIIDDYPRLKNLPKPGFTGGSCLRKDSLQLASWHNGATFSLGYDASLVNESLPLWVFRKMRSKFGNLSNKTIGILGMSFKSDCDDIRDSLSYRMKHILENECKLTLCSDPFVKNESFVNINFLLENSDIIILMTPHTAYKNLNIDKPTIDVWNFLNKGVGI